MTIRKATPKDAAALAQLINLAGEGIPAYLWSGMAEAGETTMDVGTRRAARDTGGFSYVNAVIAEDEGELLGMMLSYKQPDTYDLSDIDEYPDLVVPLVKLEAKAPGSYYVNAIATEAAHRRKGVARTLLAHAEERAQADKTTQLSLIVASENVAAMRLYEATGFTPGPRLPVVDYPGAMHGGDWILMTKDVR